MEHLIIIFNITAAVFLIGIAIYSYVYFSQIEKIEQQFGLKLPIFLKKMLGFLAMVPMIVSIAVLTLVLVEMVNL